PACGAGETCVGGACVECVDDDVRCSEDGTSTQTCDAATGTWNAPEACTYGCFGEEPTAYCGDCDSMNHKRCIDGPLATCNTETGKFPTEGTESCSGHGCRGMAPNAVCNECTDNSTQCNMGQIRTCSNGQWGTYADCPGGEPVSCSGNACGTCLNGTTCEGDVLRSEEHTSELQSRENLVCRLLLEKKKTQVW